MQIPTGVVMRRSVCPTLCWPRGRALATTFATLRRTLSMLCEGSSMRSISRVADVSINTVYKLRAIGGLAVAACAVGGSIEPVASGPVRPSSSVAEPKAVTRDPASGPVRPSSSSPSPRPSPETHQGNQRRVLCEPNADEGARDRAQLASGLEMPLAFPGRRCIPRSHDRSGCPGKRREDRDGPHRPSA